MLYVLHRSSWPSALLGFVISTLLPHLGELSASVSSYTRAAPDGWYVLVVRFAMPRADGDRGRPAHAGHALDGWNTDRADPSSSSGAVPTLPVPAAGALRCSWHQHARCGDRLSA